MRMEKWKGTKGKERKKSVRPATRSRTSCRAAMHPRATATACGPHRQSTTASAVLSQQASAIGHAPHMRGPGACIAFSATSHRAPAHASSAAGRRAAACRAATVFLMCFSPKAS